MSNDSNKQTDHWFIKKDTAITGPFPVKLIGSYLILGRISLQTLVSPDKEKWIPLARLPSLIPEEYKLADTAEGKVQLRQAKQREDERRGDIRRDEKITPKYEQVDHQQERRQARDRRVNNETISSAYLALKADISANKINSKQRLLYGTVLVGIVFSLLVMSFFIIEPSAPITKTDCQVAAAPNIDWQFCKKYNIDLRLSDLSNSNLNSTDFSGSSLAGAKLTAANLSYANLQSVDLTNARLVSAKLTGANLSAANLSSADLSNADVSYADLRNANLSGVRLSNTRFDSALWIDGQTCLKPSIDRCRTAKAP